MRVNREVFITDIICILLVIMTGIIRNVFRYLDIDYIVLIMVLQLIAVFLWFSVLKKREVSFYHKAYQHFYYIAYLVVFWIIIKTLKYDLAYDSAASRYLWYLYYLPTVFIPSLMYLSVTYITDNRYHKILSVIIYIISVILFILVMTNDLHEMVFTFMNNPPDNNYEYGIIYYVIVIYIGVVFFRIIYKILKATTISQYRHKIYIPLTVLMILLIDVICKVSGIRFVQNFLQFPELYSFIYLVFIETLLSLHLLPTNENYVDFFSNTSLPAGIYDSDGKLFAKSRADTDVKYEDIISNNLKPDDEHEIIINKTDNAMIYHVKDIGLIKKMNQMLKEHNELLMEENNILESEREIKKEEALVRNRNRLYDRISDDLKDYIIKISNILKSPDDDEILFRKNMNLACIYNVYIKRRSNLLILSYDHEYVEVNELYLSIRESMDYLGLYGVKCECFNDVKGMMKTLRILELYEIYQNIINDNLNDLDSIMINISGNENIIMRISYDIDKDTYTFEYNGGEVL